MRYGSEMELEDELELEMEFEGLGEFEGEEEFEVARIVRALKFWEIAKKLHSAGRLGWRAGRWIDKQSKWIFGEPISKEIAEHLYKHFGRSERLEHFFDSLPSPVKKWLWSL